MSFGEPAVCTPTETQTGGAQAVAYSCEDTGEEENACGASGPQADPITVDMDFDPFDEDPIVTVTNTFSEPAPEPEPAPESAPATAPALPPEPLVVTPTLTG